jgi:hypothetical protein
MSTSKIQAIEMVRDIRDQILKETQALSPEEFKAFIAREAGKVAEQSERLKSRRPAA